MGQVWLARDPSLGREVAVKVLHDAVGSSLHRRYERFVAEARIAAQLDHPGIVPVHELGETPDGLPFLVMRRIRGRSLAWALERRDRDEGPGTAELLDAMVRVCHAVGHAHHRGVVHRDLKPDNIMLGPDGEVVVVDWGLATLRGEAHDGRAPVDAGDRLKTQDGSVVGTLGYLAPEAAEGALDRIGPHSDVFSLAAVLYELLSGRPAITGADLWLATLQGPIPPLTQVLPTVDPDLATICMRGLTAQPEGRWTDARALAKALVAWREGRSRRARADAEVATGRSKLGGLRRALAEVTEADRAARSLEQGLDPWLPVDHPDKQSLHAQRTQVADARLQLALTFAEVEAAGEAALRHDPSHRGARDLLADAHLERFLDAERRGVDSEAAYHRTRLASYDEGSRQARLGQRGVVSLRTRPSGLRVTARPVQRRGLVWPLGETVDLGTTPLRSVSLDPGSWVLEVHGLPYPVRYPVLLTRGEHWDVHADEALVLPDRVPTGWVFVPGGPFLAGGDPHVNVPRPAEIRHTASFLVARDPVSASDWAAWVAHVATTDPARAEALLPRGSRNATRPMWPVEAATGARFPLDDVDGDTWQADWPMCGVRWADACAYAAWVGERLGLPVQLVGEDAYEKAARGVDGRSFPWGDTWDPALCKSLHSRRGTPRPEPIGAFPNDMSVYGVRDLAGSMRTWCAEDQFDGDPALRPMRGGFWGADHRLCRAANRYGTEPDDRRPFLGLRLSTTEHTDAFV